MILSPFASMPRGQHPASSRVDCHLYRWADLQKAASAKAPANRFWGKGPLNPQPMLCRESASCVHLILFSINVPLYEMPRIILRMLPAADGRGPGCSAAARTENGTWGWWPCRMRRKVGAGTPDGQGQENALTPAIGFGTNQQLVLNMHRVWPQNPAASGFGSTETR